MNLKWKCLTLFTVRCKQVALNPQRFASLLKVQRSPNSKIYSPGQNLAANLLFKIMRIICEIKDPDYVNIFTAHQPSCGKVVFLLLSVCSQGESPCDHYSWCIVPHCTPPAPPPAYCFYLIDAVFYRYRRVVQREARRSTMAPGFIQLQWARRLHRQVALRLL